MRTIRIVQKVIPTDVRIWNGRPVRPIENLILQITVNLQSSNTAAALLSEINFFKLHILTRLAMLT